MHLGLINSLVPAKKMEELPFFCKDITLFFPHIYKKENFCEDRLANFGAFSFGPQLLFFFRGTLFLILQGMSTLEIGLLF